MKIAAILSVHNKQDVSLDTLNSILHNMTDKVLLLVDGEYWGMWESIDIPAYKLCGFNHAWPKAPYRNVLLGLMSAYKYWKNEIDWFVYIEYDCLVGSSGFKKELTQAEKDGVWCVGSNYRRNQTVNLSFVERIIKDKFEEIVYLLGACIFYHKSFLGKMLESEFFDKFLFYTNEFKKGYFPFYDAWDLTEHLLPTMVKHFGGQLKELSFYSEDMRQWGGNYRKYPIRYRPDIDTDIEPFLNSCIIHPLKIYDHPLREYYRSKRLK